MTSSSELALLIVLIGLLVVVSAVAGGLWWRLRAKPLVDVSHLADVLAARLRTLDALLSKLDSLGTDPPEAPRIPKRGSAERPLRPLRVDTPAPRRSPDRP